MARSGPPRYYIRRVQYIREEFQIIDAEGNQPNYVNVDSDNISKRGSLHARKAIGPEEIKILEGLRLLTESEAGLMNLPFEGDRYESE